MRRIVLYLAEDQKEHDVLNQMEDMHLITKLDCTTGLYTYTETVDDVINIIGAIEEECNEEN